MLRRYASDLAAQHDSSLSQMTHNEDHRHTQKKKTAYHGGSNHHKSNWSIFRRVVHADSALVLCEHVGKGGVDGNGVDGVQPARHIGDAD